jgi:hypothetical protein
MGKKPVVGLIGLVWAGIALTGAGCGECCRNCRNKYNASPTFQTRTDTNSVATKGTPVMVGDTRPATATPAARVAETPGTTGFAKDPGIQQTGATATPGPDVTTAGGMPPVSALRPQMADRAPGAGMPGRAEASEMSQPVSRTGMYGEDTKPMRMPATPVVPSMPAASACPNTGSASCPGCPPPPMGTPGQLPPIADSATAVPPPPGASPMPTGKPFGQ